MRPKNCDRCGKPLPVQVGKGRPRVRHDRCPQPSPSDRERLKRMNPDPAVPPPIREDPEPGAAPRALETATRKTLEAVSRETTPLGIAALATARRIDFSTLLDTGSQYASLMKEFRAVLTDAMADVESRQAAEDPMDEVARRRAEKASGQ